MDGKFIEVSEGLPELVNEKYLENLGNVRQSKPCYIQTEDKLMQVGYYREVIENGVPVRGWWSTSRPASNINNDGKKIPNVIRWLCPEYPE